MKYRVIVPVLALVALASVTATAPATTARATAYANCTALNRALPHGVGKRGAVDHVRGSTTPVTYFKRDNATYNANTKSDRDKDGVACEKL
ncbi:MAG: excalibur calcium-binding protein [Thermoleophilia bacterium]|nr:excalibur calcium-binding protein [Thermoleophilia bacterium]